MDAFASARGRTWRVLLNLAELAIILAVFSRLQAPFEIAIAAMLGLAYARIRSAAFTQLQGHGTVMLILLNDLAGLQAVLGDDTEERRRKLRETEEGFERMITDASVDRLFLLATGLICLCQLLRTFAPA